MGVGRCYIDVLALDLEKALDAAARVLAAPECADPGFQVFRPGSRGAALPSPERQSGE